MNSIKKDCGKLTEVPEVIIILRRIVSKGYEAIAASCREMGEDLEQYKTIRYLL